MEWLRDSSVLLIHRQLGWKGSRKRGSSKLDDSLAPQAAIKEHAQVLLTTFSYIQSPQLDFSTLHPLVPFQHFP